MSADTRPDGDDGSIDDWIAQLSGRSAEADPSTEVLRRSILGRIQREQAEHPANAADTERAWQQLRFRLRREGLLDQVQQPAWRSWVPTAAAAAVLAALLLPVVMQDPATYEVTDGDPPILRGDGAGVLRGAEPLARAQRLAAELADRGVQPLLYFREGTATLDFELDMGNIDGAEQALRALAPKARVQMGFNRLVFRP